jgi:hypothetical protein
METKMTIANYCLGGERFAMCFWSDSAGRTNIQSLSIFNKNQFLMIFPYFSRVYYIYVDYEEKL